MPPLICHGRGYGKSCTLMDILSKEDALITVVVNCCQYRSVKQLLSSLWCKICSNINSQLSLHVKCQCDIVTESEIMSKTPVKLTSFVKLLYELVESLIASVESNRKLKSSFPLFPRLFLYFDGFDEFDRAMTTDTEFYHKLIEACTVSMQL